MAVQFGCVDKRRLQVDVSAGTVLWLKTKALELDCTVGQVIESLKDCYTSGFQRSVVAALGDPEQPRLVER